MRVLAVGCGECGGRLAEELARPIRVASGLLGRKVRVVLPIIVNTTRLDMWKIAPSLVSEAQWINVDESHVVRGLEKGEEILGGAGARRDKGKAIFVSNKQPLLEAIWESIPNAEREPPNVVLITTGLGGGTGSSFTPGLADGIAGLLAERCRVHPPIFVLGVLPLRPPREKIDFTQNATECIRELYASGSVSGLFLVDNEVWATDAGVQSRYAEINASVARQLRPLFEPPGHGTEGGQSLDAEDIRSHVMISEGVPGVCTVATRKLLPDRGIRHILKEVRTRACQLVGAEEGKRWFAGLMLVRLAGPLPLLDMEALETEQEWLQSHSLSGSFATFFADHPEQSNDVTLLLTYSPPDLDRLRELPQAIDRPRKEIADEERRRVQDWVSHL